MFGPLLLVQQKNIYEFILNAKLGMQTNKTLKCEGIHVGEEGENFGRNIACTKTNKRRKNDFHQKA